MDLFLIHVRCQGQLHRLAICDRGPIVLLDHDLRRERLALELGGRAPRCVQVLDQIVRAISGETKLPRFRFVPADEAHLLRLHVMKLRRLRQQRHKARTPELHLKGDAYISSRLINVIRPAVAREAAKLGVRLHWHPCKRKIEFDTKFGYLKVVIEKDGNWKVFAKLQHYTYITKDGLLMDLDRMVWILPLVRNNNILTPVYLEEHDASLRRLAPHFISKTWRIADLVQESVDQAYNELQPPDSWVPPKAVVYWSADSTTPVPPG